MEGLLLINFVNISINYADSTQLTFSLLVVMLSWTCMVQCCDVLHGKQTVLNLKD